MKPEDQHPRLSAGLYMNIHIHAPACSCMHNTCTFFLYLVPLFLPPKLWYYPRMTLAPRVHLSRHQIGILIQLDLLASSSPLFSWWTLMFQRGVVWTEHLHPPPNICGSLSLRTDSQWGQSFRERITALTGANENKRRHKRRLDQEAGFHQTSDILMCLDSGLPNSRAMRNRLSLCCLWAREYTEVCP